jgi:hypothetical protein
MTILRGKRIEEFRREELIELHQQIDRELPQLIDQLGAGDLARLLELEEIENELERRHDQ